jgi:hypothetical protein
MGVPSAIMGLLVWWLKKYIDDNERKRNEREENTEKLMLLMLQTIRATNVLSEATAKAVQRIPDAHCNGDMTAALAEAERIQNEEKEFLFNQGIKRIFEKD